MLQDLWNGGAGETAFRAVIIYTFALVLVRLGSRRFLSKATAFDVVVAIMLGSIMSRGIDESSPLFTIMVAGTVLIGMHWLFAFLSYRTEWFGSIVKGGRLLLIEDGKIQEKGMRRGNITRHDLTQAIRRRTKQTDPSKIKLAYLERDGEISVIPFKEEPQIVNVSVEKGVQTVRIELQ